MVSTGAVDFSAFGGFDDFADPVDEYVLSAPHQLIHFPRFYSRPCLVCTNYQPHARGSTFGPCSHLVSLAALPRSFCSKLAISDRFCVVAEPLDLPQKTWIRLVVVSRLKPHAPLF